MVGQVWVIGEDAAESSVAQFLESRIGEKRFKAAIARVSEKYD
ncbi:MAG: hypothetical protein ACJAYX_002098 [Planctomycetota bacterium]|jgi:hypothetical protein